LFLWGSGRQSVGVDMHELMSGEIGDDGHKLPRLWYLWYYAVALHLLVQKIQINLPWRLYICGLER